MLHSRKGFNEKKDRDGLKLEGQLCFALYACAKDLTRKYKTQLKDFGLTYTQYIAMLVLWETGSVNVKTLGERLYLDSGTLTPMLKKMENAGLIKRDRDAKDERNVIISVTDAGMKIKDRVAAIPSKISEELPITASEEKQLSEILAKLRTGLSE